MVKDDNNQRNGTKRIVDITDENRRWRVSAVNATSSHSFPPPEVPISAGSMQATKQGEHFSSALAIAEDPTVSIGLLQIRRRFFQARGTQHPLPSPLTFHLHPPPP